MNGLARTNKTLRGGALLLLGALLLHWLRYLFAYGGSAGAELHRQGHGYLVDLLPSLIALALAMTGAAALIRIVRPFAAERSVRPLVMASAYAVALFATFSVQELSEGFLAHGHASGLDALLADGGWVSAPLSLALGALIVLCDRLLERGEVVLAVRLSHMPCVARRRSSSTAPPVSPSIAPRASRPLAFGLARRPPPAPLPS